MNHRIRLHFQHQHQVFVSRPFNPGNARLRSAVTADVWWQAAAHGLTKRNEPVITEENEDGTPVVEEKAKAVQIEIPLPPRAG